MTRDRQRRLAAEFRALHRSGRIIVLPNAFDAASARLFARHGPVAIGTTSAGLAWASGYADGERIPRDEMLAAVERIVRAVDIGVTVDAEAGYGDAPEDAAATAGAVIGVGGIGANLEDVANGHPTQLLTPEHAAEKIAAVRDTADREGIDLVVNARTDVFLAGAAESEEDRIAAAIDRGNLYFDAGADCVFVPGATAVATIEALVSGIRGPVNVYVLASVPSIAELERLGVARVSVGGGPYQACLALVDEIARALLGERSYEPMLARQLAYSDIQELFA